MDRVKSAKELFNKDNFKTPKYLIKKDKVSHFDVKIDLNDYDPSPSNNKLQLSKHLT
jgi:hypothetical protein